MRSAKFGTQGPASPSHSTVYIQTVKDHDRSARHGETKRKIAYMSVAHLRDAVDAIARTFEQGQHDGDVGARPVEKAPPTAGALGRPECPHAISLL